MHVKRVLISSFFSVLLFVASLHLFVTKVQSRPQGPGTSTSLIITGVLFDPYLTNEPEESVQIQNISANWFLLDNCKISDNEGTVTFPPGWALAPNQKIWVSKNAAKFREEFGFNPAFEYGSDSDPVVPNMTGTAPTFANAGDEIILLDPNNNRIDVVVYDSGNQTEAGWSGPTVTRYNQGFFGLEGQILYRKLDEASGQPLPDTNSAADWAQTKDDDILGKKVQYPGWNLDEFFQTAKVSDMSTVQYCVAPDHLYECIMPRIMSATSSIKIETLTMSSAQLTDALVSRLKAGVSVTVLLEEEVVGGISDQGKWACQQIEANGGQCWFMFNDDALDIHDRYTFQHSKFVIIDGSLLLTGSENLNGSALAADDKADGTSGNRGVYLITDSTGLISHFEKVFSKDFDPLNHKDIRRWNPSTDSPPAGFVPDFTTGGTTYTVQFPNSLTETGSHEFEVVQCPENCLRQSDALLGMVAKASAGDTVLVEQLNEHTFWGVSTSNPVTDPNPRLEAYIAAARRGATVKILLDSFFDDPTSPRSNRATCLQVNGMALPNLQCRLGNPTGTGIHNKMVLVSAGTQGYVHTGSINGTENSNKNNREIAVQLASTAAFNFLKAVFESDWVVSATP